MELQTVSLCPICEHNQFAFVLNCKDHTVTKEEFQIQKCEFCGFLLTNPRPSPSDIGSYYQSDKYISHSQKGKGGLDIIYRIVRKYTLRWKQRLIEQKHKKGRLLDYGCGTGQFLLTMQSAGWQVTGVEPAANACEQANSLLSNAADRVVHSQLNQSIAQKFEVITLWHVLEHVHELSDTLQQLKGKLEPDGYLFIAVPNYESWDAAAYGDCWAGYDVPRHLWHFSKTSMMAILRKNNLKHVEIIPMKLDAYYVSLLSEKNKNEGRINISALLNGMRVAFKSNAKGNAAKNHSSLIYIARHA